MKTAILKQTYVVTLQHFTLWNSVAMSCTVMRLGLEAKKEKTSIVRELLSGKP